MGINDILAMSYRGKKRLPSGNNFNDMELYCLPSNESRKVPISAEEVQEKGWADAAAVAKHANTPGTPPMPGQQAAPVPGPAAAPGAFQPPAPTPTPPPMARARSATSGPLPC